MLGGRPPRGCVGRWFCLCLARRSQGGADRVQRVRVQSMEDVTGSEGFLGVTLVTTKCLMCGAETRA